MYTTQKHNFSLKNSMGSKTGTLPASPTKAQKDSEKRNSVGFNDDKVNKMLSNPTVSSVTQPREGMANYTAQ